jgi:hypothetical protein
VSTRSHFLGDDDQTNWAFYWYQFLSRIGVLWLVGKSEKRGLRMSGDGDEMRRSRSSRTAATTTGAMLVVAILLPQPQPNTPPSTSRYTTVFRRLQPCHLPTTAPTVYSLPVCRQGKNPRGEKRPAGYFNSWYIFLYPPRLPSLFPFPF